MVLLQTDSVDELDDALGEVSQISDEVCERARLARDARFDGRFFIGVRTTDIFCRPICPVRPPKAENVTFFPSAAAAQEAGYRPCLRCRPEAAPGTPAWVGTSATVSRALRLLGEGALDQGGVEELADRLGVGARHLRRLFVRHLGASPIAVAQTRRLLFAKKLLDETHLSMTMVAECAGFRSLRRFNEVFKQVYGRTPRELRKRGASRVEPADGGLTVQLSFRPPLDWQATTDYLALRATPGVEEVEEGVYRRSIRLGDDVGRIEVAPRLAANSLVLRVDFPDWRCLSQIVQRVRRIFDLEADPMEIASQLESDPILAPRIAAHRGLRLVGAWDGFELTIRAILGQQVSVKGATTLAGRLAERFGEVLPGDAGGAVARLFPRPEAIVDADLRSIGMPGKRAQALSNVARATLNGDLQFDAPLAIADIVRQLTQIPGVGDWTAQYVAMRAFGEPDALPASDLGLLKALGTPGQAATAAQLRGGPKLGAPGAPMPRCTFGLNEEAVMYYTHLDSPIGRLLVAGDDQALRCVAFPRVRKGRRSDEVEPDWNPNWSHAPDRLRGIREQLEAYFDGKLEKFDVPVEPEGTSFQLDVWAALREIPYGERVSYAEIAARIGRPKACRAVGAANGRNPIPIVIPCHRVVGSGGKLTGFAGGLETKEALLELESR